MVVLVKFISIKILESLIRIFLKTVSNLLYEMKMKREQDTPRDEKVYIDPYFEELIVNRDVFGFFKEQKVGK